ncbi:MAG: amidohydrolase [Nitrososphaerota archaeon]|nr:amidohydrolase [Nitrososphaerota archaeon]
MTVVDFHNHFYPKGYVNELKKGEGYASITTDSSGRLVAQYTGDYNIVVGPHIILEDRIRAMKKCGIDMEVLTLTTPGVERETVERGRKLARITNDEYGSIIEKYPDTFTALATLPMQDPAASVEELERAVKDRGLRGAMIFSNVDGKPLDSPEFVSIFEKAAQLDVPLFIHPTSPINSSYMDDYRLVPILGFCVDTSLAILRIVFSGIMEKIPRLKLVATHTGGVFPYLRGRIEAGYNAYPECKVNITRSPSTYLKKIWLDTVCYDEDVMISSYSFVGGEKMLLGTDFPHQISDIENAVGRVRRLKIDDEEKEKILGGNAIKLLKL